MVFRIRPSAKIESFKRIHYAKKFKGMSWGKTQEKLEFFKKLKKKRESPKKGKQTLLYRWQFEKYPKITVDNTKCAKSA